MKLFLVAALASSAAAFAPVPSARINTALQAAGADAIEAALAASKEHGATSKEARVLWDIVEEMDSADNRCVSNLLQFTLGNHILFTNFNSRYFMFLPRAHTESYFMFLLSSI